jgi:CubicO group peptidase (beta-lactamase class C family)
MSRLLSLFPAVLLAFPVASQIASIAQSATPAPNPAQLAPAQLPPIFSAYQHKDTPGCAVAVDAPGQPTLTAAYGMADLEHNVSNTSDTVFEAGSVSKQFTAAAVLLLVERKQIALDDDIRKYFPEIPAYEKPITIRELLNHTSGLRDWGEVESIAGWPRTTREYTHAHVLEILSRQRALNYPPGAAWSYTNSGYNLAAMLVERVSGMSLEEFSRKEFFEPLGMTATQWRDDFRRIVPNRAIAYEKRAQEWSQDMPFEDIYGNGGLLTTVGDLLKWNSNIATGKLHPEIFAQMQQPSKLSDGHAINYGLGFFLETIQGLPAVDHSGATAAYRAWLGRIPSKGLSVAVLCNASTANTTQMAHQIFSLYLGPAPPETPTQPKDPKPGLYESLRDHGATHVAETNGILTFDNQPARLKVRFAGNTMYTTSPVYGEDAWERVEPWVPKGTPQDLSGFTGNYSSEEAETTLTVALEAGKLVIHRHPDSQFPLIPTYADAFSSDLGSIRFLRDASGKIVSLSLGQARVWDLRFAREEFGTKADSSRPSVP